MQSLDFVGQRNAVVSSLPLPHVLLQLILQYHEFSLVKSIRKNGRIVGIKDDSVFTIRKEILYCNNEMWNENGDLREFMGCNKIVPVSNSCIFDGVVVKWKHKEPKYIWASYMSVYHNEVYYVDGGHVLVHVFFFDPEKSTLCQ